MVSDGEANATLNTKVYIVNDSVDDLDFRGKNISDRDFSNQDLSSALFDKNTIFSDGATGVNLNNTNARIGTIHGGTAVDFSGAKL